MNDFTVDNVIDVLADYIEPIAGTCQQAQANRIPMPKGQFCILTPLTPKRLSTTRDIQLDTGSPTTSQMAYTEVRQFDIQVDVYGQGAADRAIALETTFASSYGYDKIKSLDERLAPLYSTAPFNAAMTDGESQWQERWTLTLSAQAHIAVSFQQDYFDKAEISTEQVDDRP
ncbi:hypothetical protein [Citrobacter werkmanii]|uniref:phage neck terminator protein n=1 Tax=Citrobacter werkmanii TaxID=67827 RepID=UPI00351D5926